MKEQIEFDGLTREKIIEVNCILIIFVIFIIAGIVFILWDTNRTTPQDYCNEVYGEKSQISYNSQPLYNCLVIKNNKIENYYFTKKEYSIWMKERR